jgi:PAS domain S-box-containing protein
LVRDCRIAGGQEEVGSGVIEKEQVTVVVIEDDPDDAFIIQDLLSDSRFLDATVIVASTYAEGMAELDKNCGDVYLIDQHLGAELGVSLIEEARRRGIKKPLILLTGNDSPEVDQEAQRAGANDYIVKFELTTSMLERTIRYGIAQWLLFKNQEQLLGEMLARREAEKREAQWHLLSETLPYGLWLTDAEGKIEYISCSFLKLMHCHAGDDISDLEFADLLPKKLRQRWQRTLERGTPWNEDIEVTSEKGNTIYILSRGMPVHNHAGETIQWVGINLDVTQEKRLEKRKDEFLKIASHELKSPITSIISSLYILRDELGKSDQQIGLEYVGRMQRQLNNLTQLVEDLLDLSKIEMDKLSYHPQIINLRELIHEVVEMMSAQATHAIELDMPEDVYLEADRHRLSQVLVNLLSNAIKFSPDKDHVSLTVKPEEEMIVIQVSDLGIGIPEKELPRVFDKFFSGEEDRVRKITGLGLGLFLTKKIVDLHHGSISVTSEVGKGTTFTVILPIRQTKTTL